MPQSTRFTMIENDDFKLDCEYNDQFFILHLPQMTASKGALQHLQVKLEELQEFVDKSSWQLMFTALDPNDKKMKKLMRLIGAEYSGTSDNLDVYVYKGVI